MQTTEVKTGLRHSILLVITEFNNMNFKFAGNTYVAVTITALAAQFHAIVLHASVQLR